MPSVWYCKVLANLRNVKINPGRDSGGLTVAESPPWLVFHHLSAALDWIYSWVYYRVLITVQSKGPILVEMSHEYGVPKSSP